MDLLLALNELQSNIYFIKGLLLILFGVLIFVIVRKVPAFKDNTGVSIIIALALSLLAVGFLPEDVLTNYILRPYKALGIILILSILFLIILFFAHRTSFTGIGRRIIIILYAIVLAGLWFYRYNETTSAETKLYIIMFVVIALAIIFDKTLQNLLKKRFKMN